MFIIIIAQNGLKHILFWNFLNLMKVLKSKKFCRWLQANKFPNKEPYQLSDTIVTICHSALETAPLAGLIRQFCKGKNKTKKKHKITREKHFFLQKKEHFLMGIFNINLPFFNGYFKVFLIQSLLFVCYYNVQSLCLYIFIISKDKYGQ